MKNYKFLLFLGLLACSIFQGCSKQGPAGPAGATGPSGTPGAPGAPGPQGPIGSATVIYSGWFPASQWVRALDSVADYTFDKLAPSISTAIIDKGVIMAYVKLVADSGAIRQLPSTIITSNFFAHHGYLIPPGGGKLRFTFNNYGGTNLPDTATQYRYLIIPGGLVGGRIMLHGSIYTSQQLGGMDYSQIKQLFQLPENGSNQ